MKNAHAWGRIALVLAGLACAGAARGEAYLTPFAAGAFSGDAEDWTWTYGASLAFAGEGSVLGFAVDFGHTPGLLGSSRVADSKVTSLMGNLVLITPGRPRLYGSAGLGLLKTGVETAGGLFDADSDDFGFNVGGGLYLIGSGPLGLNADVRYFRAFTDLFDGGQVDLGLGQLHYWRAAAGLTLRF